MDRMHMTYTEGWHDGYKASREDLIEKLTEKAEQTIDGDFANALDWLITMLENGEFNGVAYSEE